MFFWGAATSSHQVEGGNYNDWSEWEIKSAKIKVQNAKLQKWPEFILNPPAGGPNPLQEENYISGKAAEHYRRFHEDFDIAKSLGHNAHRFSIEWSRIEPEQGTFDEEEIKHYRNVVEALRKRGLEPFVSLWHFTLPLWLRKIGGTENKEFPSYFQRYAEKITAALKDKIRFWITLNEPEIYSLNACFRGRWPPQKKSIFSFYKSLRNLAAAHQNAYEAIKTILPKAEVGAAVNLSYFESSGGLINDFFKNAAEGLMNFHFLNSVCPKIDFIGLNYYFHNRIDWGFNKNANKWLSDMEWEIYPEGIYHVLTSLKKYKLPIYITENGVADSRDILRQKFIQEHIIWIKKAIKEGINVRGYFYWSLLDNFEWDKGFWPRFGLVEVNYKTLKRKIRPSALAYKKIIEGNRAL